jgi:hypothetical protein
MAGRTATKPRMASITEEAIRAELATMMPKKDLAEAVVGRALMVVEYVRTGTGAFDEAQRLAALLYSSPARRYASVDPSEVVVGREPERAIDVVLLAAEARACIEAGNRVAVGALAALGSVHPNEIARLKRDGRLGSAKRDGRDGPAIPAGAAAKWLRERGIDIVVRGES